MLAPLSIQPPRGHDIGLAIMAGDRNTELIVVSIAFDCTRVGEGRFIDVNESFERLTGFARDEVIGRTSSESGLG